MKLKWSEWDRTHENVLEWSTWDSTDVWFATVVKEGVVWRWHAAFAPGAGDALLKHESWTFTKASAMRKAKAWAERLAKFR